MVGMRSAPSGAAGSGAGAGGGLLAAGLDALRARLAHRDRADVRGDAGEDEERREELVQLPLDPVADDERLEPDEAREERVHARGRRALAERRGEVADLASAGGPRANGNKLEKAFQSSQDREPGARITADWAAAAALQLPVSGALTRPMSSAHGASTAATPTTANGNATILASRWNVC